MSHPNYITPELHCPAGKAVQRLRRIGDEGEVRSIVLDEVKPFADEVKVDALGNVLAVRHAKTRNPLRVMLAAHMDEVGFMLIDRRG